MGDPVAPPSWLEVLNLAELLHNDARDAAARAVTFSAIGEPELAQRALGLAEGFDFTARCLTTMFAQAPR